MSPALLALLASAASAADFYLEGPDRPEKSEATTLEKAVGAAGHEARVVRRFVDGAGWRYVVRVEGFADEASARRAAAELATNLSAAFALFETDGRTANRLGTIAPDGAPEAAPAGDDEDAEPVLEQVIAAHGVTQDTLPNLMGGPSLVGFRRTLSDGKVVDHVWATRGGSVFVEIRAVEGAVKPSRTLVTGEKAWLSVDGEAWAEQNAQKASATLDALAPPAVLPLVLSLASAVETRREFERMTVASEGRVGDVATRVLRFAGDQASGPLTLEVGAKDNLVYRATFGDDEVVHEFSAYAKHGDLKLPGLVVTKRSGQEVDRVELQRFEPRAKLPDDWFTPGP